MTDPMRAGYVAGWDCRECGGEGTIKHVPDSRFTGNGSDRQVRRRRECETCGARITTLEIPIDKLNGLTLTEMQRGLLTAVTAMVQEYARAEAMAAKVDVTEDVE